VIEIEKDILTPEEAASLLKLSKYTVYEMVKRGELIATKVGRRVRIKRSDIDALLNNNKPETPIIIEDDMLNSSIIFMGSHDLAINFLVEEFAANYSGQTLIPAYVGSLNGLINLYYGKADLAGCHLFDEETEKYNLPYIKRLFTGENIKIINFAKRNIGWVVQKGNPKNIIKWSDLNRTDIKFINRQKGSGTRVLLDYQLKKLNNQSSTLNGYDIIENTHYAAASHVARGDADFTLATESAAWSLGLDFVKLTEETYDLVMKDEFLKSENGKKILSLLNSSLLKDKIQKLRGYNINNIGQISEGEL
jgi:putative molybdopterin biosynthesis protein